MNDNGYDIVSENSYNESTVNELQITYESIFPVEAVLRKEIKLEFMVISLMGEVHRKPIGSLVKNILADNVNGTVSDIQCASLSEIAANKWVAFTRRVAVSERGYKPADPTVIRHLYDLNFLKTHNAFDEKTMSLIRIIIENEKLQYGKYHQEYVLNPLSEIQYSIEKLTSNEQWQDAWNGFIKVMVYDNEKITFANAISGFGELTQSLMDFW